MKKNISSNIIRIFNELPIKNIISTLFSMVQKIFYDIFHFGLKISFYNFWVNFANSDLLPGKVNKIVRKKSLDLNVKFLEGKFGKLIEKYKKIGIGKGINSKKIWLFWRQGIDTAPDLVKICINSIKKHSSEYDVVFLDKDNYTDYANIPGFIIQKLNGGYITITHFSDILRMFLLKEYGGIWVDATMFINSDIFERFNDKIINSECSEKKSCGDNDRWSGFFIGGKSNKIFSFCYDFFIEYHKCYDKIINYFLIDYALHIVYRNFEDCRFLIDKMDIKNDKLFWLTQNFNKPYTESIYNKIIKNNFFKLTRKLKFYEKINGELTNYGKFINDNSL